MKHIPEIRYDLNGNTHYLDLDSQMRLLDLGQQWAARNAALAEEEPFELAPYEELDGWPALIDPS